MSATLSLDEAKQVYDRLGPWIDFLKFYENKVVDKVIHAGRFDGARSVFEFGCGTGRIASRLLESYLPEDSRYVASDISTTMVELTRRRLAKWKDRVQITQVDTGPLPFDDATFDRFLSTFVFDLLEPEYLRSVVSDAHRLLKPNGVICLTSLCLPGTPLARIVTSCWERLWETNSALLGGCRPIDLWACLPEDSFRIDYYREMTQFGLTSAALTATKLDGPGADGAAKEAG